MFDEQFLQRIFNGYVNCYRKNNWHTTSNYSDMTHAELGFFKELGESLGFFVRMEMKWEYPRDLCWCENSDSSEAFLYIERENKDNRCLDTVMKQLNNLNSSSIPFLVSLFGWVKPDTLDTAKQYIRNNIPEDKAYLIISWIGDRQDGNDFIVEGWVLYSGHETKRIAIPKIDGAKYWYLLFEKDSEWV
jgi:hypothetical protein